MPRDAHRPPRQSLIGQCFFDLALTGRDDPDNMTEGLIEALEPLFDSGDVLDAVLAKNEDEAQALWQLREEIPTAVRSSGGNIKNDISVPRGSLCRFEKPLPNSRKKRRGSPRPFSVITATATCTSTLGTARSWARGSGSSTNVKSTAW